MSSISDRIEGIESKIRRLADQLATTRAEKARLAKENARLLQVMQNVRTQLSQQKAELITAEEASSSDVWQQQIDDHIKQLDACLEELSNKQA